VSLNALIFGVSGKGVLMDLIKIIETAIADEQADQKKYRDAAELAEDSQTRNVLLQLSRDEHDHEKKLRDRLTALKLLKTD
jgi:rubrerythrin